MIDCGIDLLTMTVVDEADEPSNGEKEPKIETDEKNEFDLSKYTPMLQHIGIGIGATFVALILTGNTDVIIQLLFLPAWNFVLYIIGTALGIGLGLGLAIHVHESLDGLKRDNSKSSDRKLASPLKKSSNTQSVMYGEEENS